MLLSVLAPEGPFADLDYEAALAKAKEQQKLLFVDFTASWCGPCKKMEAETWPAAEVVAWLGEHAIAIQVDVDKQKDLAQQFKVKAMPTVVALRGGEEFDRVVGYKDAASFLAWAQDVAAGKRSIDELMERAKKLAESDDVEARYDLADDLLTAGQYDLALEHYLWVWPASRKVNGMGGVRLSFMLSEMADLAREYPPAKEAFQKLLDGLQTQVDADGIPDFDTWQEWSSMCQWFGEKQRVVAWYEKRRDPEGRLFPGRSRDFLVQHIIDEVAAVLVEQDRPEDAARLQDDAPADPSEDPFADLDYEAALALANEQQKLLFVDFIVVGRGGPCGRMAEDTWAEAEVVAWLGEHAIAIQVDVEEEKELAQQFGIDSIDYRTIPTVAALRGGEELDRVVGYRASNSFLAWARGLGEGKRSIDEVMKRAEDLADSGDIRARTDLARDLLQAERYDLALQHYLWLWPATRNVSPWGGVRLSGMLSEMADLARKHPPAEKAFLEVLDGLEARVAGEGIPEFDAWQEWSSMCEHFGEQQRIVVWYENHRDAEGMLFAARSADRRKEFLVQHIVGEVAEVLVEKSRFVDAARLFSDAYAYAEAAVTSFEEMRALEESMNQERSPEQRERPRRSHAGC